MPLSTGRMGLATGDGPWMLGCRGRGQKNNEYGHGQPASLYGSGHCSCSLGEWHQQYRFGYHHHVFEDSLTGLPPTGGSQQWVIFLVRVSHLNSSARFHLRMVSAWARRRLCFLNLTQVIPWSDSVSTIAAPIADQLSLLRLASRWEQV